MYKNIKVEAENLELILENSHGDKVIIPANKRNWVKQKLSEGCHNCIDSLVETLPIASQYAGDGSVYPPNKKVKVNENNQIKEYDISSPEYRDLYNSGKLMSYDKNTDTYTATPLKEVIITAEAPQWLKYKRKYESQYTKDWYIDNNMPKFSRSMGVSADNMHPNNVKEYDSYINDKVVEDIFKSKPTFDEDYSNDRLKTLQGFSQKELELIKNSKYASKIEPSIWSKFEQGLLSIGNAGSPVQFKNQSLSQEEAKKEDNPLNILQPLNIPSKMVQSTYKDNYSLKDALKGKQNNANIVEDIVTDPLNLVGVGLVGKLSKADKVIDAAKAVDKISDISKPTNILKFDDLKNENEFFRIIVGDEAFDDIIKTGQIRVQRPSSYKTEPGVINLDRRGITPSPSFSKGKPSIEYAKGNPEHYIIRTSEPLKPSTMGAHGKGSTMFPTDEAGKHLKSLDASKTQVYKHIGNGEYELVDVTKAGSKVLNKLDDVVNTAKPIISSVDDVIKNKPVQNGFLFDKKGFMQQYPKGDLTEMEINAVRNTNEYKQLQSDYLKAKEKYGDEWKLGNFYEDAIQKNDRNTINRILYGGSNYKTINYVGTGMVGYVGVSLPSVLGLLGLSTFGNKNQILNAHKKIGLYDPTQQGFLTSKDTVIDISDKKMDYAKVNENKDGKVILGGEFIEEANNSVRKVKDWIDVDSLDTFGDKKIKTKDINKFYGVENNKFKVGTLKDFDKETEVVPVRFKDTPIKKAVLNNKQLRLLDNDDKPIYQNTPNTGKFILHSPSSKKSIFVYINEGKKGVDEVNKFLKQNGDAFYIHLDNGRYEFYGVNEHGLTKQNFENYYEQDLKRGKNPGYNLIIK